MVDAAAYFSMCVRARAQEALLKLVDGCPRMTDFRAAYATVSVVFISAVGDHWSGASRIDSSDVTEGLTRLDLSFCKTADSDDAAVMCETLAHTLAQCSALRTLALAGFAAMRPDTVSLDDTLVLPHPADVVIEAVLAGCPCLVDLNCSETDIGAGAVASTLFQLENSGRSSSSGEGRPGCLGLARANFSGCRRLGGETFVALLRGCPNLIDLNLGYCCNEEHAQVSAAEARGRARAHALGTHKHAHEGAPVDARVITDNDLGYLRTARCADKLQGLRLGGMGSKSDVPWPTVGGSEAKAFGNNGVCEALSANGQGRILSALQTIDLSHSAVTNSTIMEVALASPELSRLNVVGSKCTRELHRMLREAGCSARVFGI